MKILTFALTVVSFFASSIASAQTTPSVSFCFGDGSIAACPCSNNGGTGRGCGNPIYPSGALLVNGGVSSVAADTMTLTAIDITGPALMFQADASAALPIAFGHGLLCASTGIRRLGLVFPSGGIATYPSFSAPDPVSVAGRPIVAGETKHYQCWYREIATQCTPLSNSSMTQALTLSWVP